MRSADPVTVVVCSRDRPERLEQCLVAVRGSMRVQDRLVVVDSASRDDETGRVASAYGADVVRLDVAGVSRARNAGLARADTEAVLFTDDDCRPAAGWVAAMTAAIAADDRLAFVTGMVVGEGGGVPTSVQPDVDPRAFDRATPIEAAGHAANVAVRVDLVRAAGGFDPMLGPGAPFPAAEDKDLFHRLLAAGHPGRYEPAGVVAHEQWRNRREAVALSYRYGIGFGAVLEKVCRADPRAGRAMRRRAIRRAGLGQAWQDLRHGYQLGTVISMSWTAGVVAGGARARRYDVVDGLLVSRSPRRRSAS